MAQLKDTVVTGSLRVTDTILGNDLISNSATIGKIKITNGTTNALQRTITVTEQNLILDTPSNYGIVFDQNGVAKCRIVADTFYPENNTNGSIGITGQRWGTGYFSSNIYVGSTSYTAYNSNTKGTHIGPAKLTVATNAGNVSGEGYLLYGAGAQYARLFVAALGTANSGDGNATQGAQGYTWLMLGNATPRPAAGTAGGANNARGRIRIYSTDANYTDILSQAGYSKQFILPKYDGDMYAVHTEGNSAMGSTSQPVYIGAGGRTTLCSSGTSNNTASTFVMRDASGNFSAGTITAGLSGNASSATRINGNLTAATSNANRNIWVSSTNAADGIPNYISNFAYNPSSSTLSVPAGTRISPNEGALYLGNSSNTSWVYAQDMCSASGNSYWKIPINGKAIFTSVYTPNGNIEAGDSSATEERRVYATTAGGTIYLYSNGSSGYGIYSTGGHVISCQKTNHGWINITNGIDLHSYAGHRLSMQNDCNLVVYNSGGTKVWASNTATSTYLVKENITPLELKELDNLRKLNVVRFDYKKEMNYYDKSRRYGLIAEEVMPLFPDMVDIPKGYDAKNFDITKGSDQPLPGIRYERFIPVLIKMVQVQQDEIDDLKFQLSKLKK